MDKYDNVKESKKEIFLNNILGGIAWGLGATVGVAIILAVFGMILSKVNTIPVVGNYVENVIKYISQKQETAIDTVDSGSTGVDNNK